MSIALAGRCLRRGAVGGSGGQWEIGESQYCVHVCNCGFGSMCARVRVCAGIATSAQSALQRCKSLHANARRKEEKKNSPGNNYYYCSAIYIPATLVNETKLGDVAEVLQLAISQHSLVPEATSITLAHIF